MPLDLSPVPPPLTQRGTGVDEPQDTLDRPPVPEDRSSLLASAWHHVAEASRRIEQLQARLAALGIAPSQSSLP